LLRSVSEVESAATIFDVVYAYILFCRDRRPRLSIPM
jgi:hypothetical protein